MSEVLSSTPMKRRTDEDETRIVHVSPSDYRILLMIWESAVKATHDFLLQEDFEYYKSRMFSYFESVSLYAYKTTDGELAGFVGVADSRIEMLFVSRLFRGAGIGSQLLRFAINHLKVHRLDVNEQNRQAVGFYLHMGFRITGRSPVDNEGKAYPLLHLCIGRD